VPHNSATHPLRARVLAEVHARPFSPIKTPRRLLHLAYVANPEAAAAHRNALISLCARCDLPGPASDVKHTRIDMPEGALVWESHSEFITCTWEVEVTGHEVEPFQPSSDHFMDRLEELPPPGPLLVAIDLHLIPDGGIQTKLQEVFCQTQIAASEAEEGRALVATDFKPNAGG
jgi:uncharacterized membrane-anchored protein